MSEITPDNVTLVWCRDEYERAVVPPHVPQDDFGRDQVRKAYTCGFAAAIAIANRLQRETPEQRAATLQRLHYEVKQQALLLTDIPSQSG